MRYITAASAAVLLCTVIFAITPTASEAAVYDSVIRLHVIANSDNESDQALKLEVRDAVINLMSELLDGVTVRKDAESAVEASLDEIEAAAAEVINKTGRDYTVKAILAPERYPTCEYGGFRLPAGEYLSLRLIIGEGAGANWWCVLFPPLCTSAALGAKMAAADELVQAGLTPEQYRIITESDERVTYKLKFKILEFVGNIFK